MSIKNFDGNDRYLKRITSEHRIRPNYMAMNNAYLDKLQDVYNVYAALLDCFNLEDAIGVQLDVLGKIVGADRILDFVPNYADSKLDDENYRRLIRAQISTNQWDGTMKGLIELWEGIFGEYRIKVLDHQDMSILAEFHGVENLFESELISRGYFAPKAAGVLVNYLFVMESKIDGEIFIGSAYVADKIIDALKEYSHYPEIIEGSVYIYSYLNQEVVWDVLRNNESPLPNIFNTNVHYGSRVANEIISEKLEGG